MMTKQQRTCIETVWQYYHANGRHDLPWRQRTHLRPYTVLVSEIMLQQTQVSRVVPKYRSFVQQFPTVSALARAPQSDVLVAWQGLGYNRRAKYLHTTAVMIREVHCGRFPRQFDGLVALPGVGSYTAAAVLNFACNEATPMIETNIRSVYLHHFFKEKTGVADTHILPLITATMDTTHPREWFWALMDYGAYLKQMYGNNTHASRHYTKQSTFKGSDREIRGAIIRVLAQHPLPKGALCAQFSFARQRIETQLMRLEREALIEKQGRCYLLKQ